MQDPLVPVKILGRYALYDAIASGGMATVHLGRLLGPVGFARTVAIKRLHDHLSSDPEFATMFLEEGRLAARIQHANVVATLDVVAEDGELFLVMEYIDGESLARLLGGLRRRGQRIPHPELGTIVSNALSGLHAAHEVRSESGEPLGVVHRDVSPENILVGRDGTSRVLDFGVAKATERGRMTQAGTIKGKINYMAPEQVQGVKLDRRVDVYGMSVVLWESLVGERLFDGGEVEVMYRVIQGTIPAPSTRNPKLTKEIDELVLKGLSRDREKRWATAREMAAEVERVLGVASTTRVAELVDQVAGEALAKRSRLVEAVESSSELKDVGTHDTLAAPMGRASSPQLGGALRGAGTDIMPAPPARSSARGAMASRPAFEPGPSFDLPDLDGAQAPAPSGPAPTSPAAKAPASGSASGARAGSMPDLDLAAASSGPYHAPPPPPAVGVAVGPDTATDGERAHALEIDMASAPSAPRPAAGLPPTSNPGSASVGRGPVSAGTPARGAVSLDATPRPPTTSAPSITVQRPVTKTSSPSGALVLAAVAAVVVLGGVAAALYVRTSTPTHRPATASPTPAPPPAVDVKQTCELARKRFRAGGAATGIELDGWVFELWLRKSDARLEEGHPKLAQAVKNRQITAELDPELTALGVGVDTARMTGPLGGKPTDEGVVLRFSDPIAKASFEPSKAARLVALADRLYDELGADTGVLSARCAHLRQNEFALWVRGKDPARTVGGLMFVLGAFADVPLIPQQLLEPKPGPDLSSFETLAAATVVDRKTLQTEIERDGGTVTDGAKGSLRITFPANEPARSGAASRRLSIDRRVLKR